MNPLDSLIRRMLLSCPAIFQTRWQVLFHLFIVTGNAFHWTPEGTLEDGWSASFDEEKARAEFFSDIEDFFSRQLDERDELHKRTLMARRQFQLDNIDGLAVEPRYLSESRVLTEYFRPGFDLTRSCAFTAPIDRLEPSFRAGLMETLSECAVALYPLSVNEGLRPIRRWMIQQGVALENLTPEERALRAEAKNQALERMRQDDY